MDTRTKIIGAELVAALAVVDHVCDDSDDEFEVTSGVKPEVSLEPEHDRRLQALIAHVHARQRAFSQNASSKNGTPERAFRE